MVLTPRLDLRQTQSLVMTPQLQQAIKLLQLSNLELTEYVERELEQNPLLERDEGPRDDLEGAMMGAEPMGEPDEPAGDGFSADGTGVLEAADLSLSNGPEVSADASLDVDYDNLWNNGEADGAGGPGAAPGGGDNLHLGGELGQFAAAAGRGFDDQDSDIAQYVAGTESLRDRLTQQIAMDLSDPADRLVAAHLMEMLDEAGYLVGDLMDLADTLNTDLSHVEAVLDRVQHFDPPGLFARSLSECLALQLRDLNRLDPAMQALLDNLDLLAKHDLQGLLRICGVDHEDLAEMVAEIRALDPKPGLTQGDDLAQPITPDVLMHADGKGGWMIELNADNLPRVLVNNHYYSTISASARSKSDRQYLSECLQSANWLVKSLHQRATTILKVATEIVRQQDAFFRQGVRHLKPLVLRDIAEAIEMHESTVSRVTSNKFMATPRGIFELKYFFTPAISSADGGEAHSAEAVRHRIKALIDAESPKSIISDDKIVAILKQESVDIARRTVAKYREAMGIPSSVQRRRQKSAQI
ncbi:MAG: RNA polymerase factor sigma-54 [Rhodobacterales bacterium]|nr:RNA polymerase factor sigma-54 [Rhodobacterales bacterium]